MNYDDYTNHKEYPTKEYEYAVYQRGEVIGKFKTSDGYNKVQLQEQFSACMIERYQIHEDEYKAKKKEYHDEDNRLRLKFKEDIFEEFGVADNPRAEQTFSLAWELGYPAGFSEVYHYFSEFVSLIK